MRYESAIDAFRQFDKNGPPALGGVYEKIIDGCRLSLVLAFGSMGLRFQVDEDSDSILVDTINTKGVALSEYTQASATVPWQNWIGKTLGWGWITINQQGYCDGVMLSLENITPKLLLSAAASNISYYEITPY